MANQNIEVWPDHDPAGIWTLNIRKKRGKLTLDEIQKACTDYEQDFYMLVICAMDRDMDQYYDTEDLRGDYVTLYSAADFMAWRSKE